MSDIVLLQIKEAIDNLQLQLDYERSKLVQALGGEPAIWSDDGTGSPGGVLFRSPDQDDIIEANSNFTSDMAGNIEIANTLKVGTGPAIAGATAQIDGAVVVGDGAGGSVADSNSFTRHKRYYNIPVSADTIIATIATTSNFVGAWLVVVNAEGVGTIANKVRLVQTSYNQNNVSPLGADTGYGLLANFVLSFNFTTSGFTVVVNMPAACSSSFYIQPFYANNNQNWSLT